MNTTGFMKFVSSICPARSMLVYVRSISLLNIIINHAVEKIKRFQIIWWNGMFWHFHELDRLIGDYFSNRLTRSHKEKGLTRTY